MGEMQSGSVAALFALVIGGMYAGAFTATEAAAMGAFGTLVLALLRRRLTWASLLRSLSKTVETIAIVTVILIGAVVLGYFLAVGLNVFVISGMVKDVPMQDIYRGILPFLAAMVVLLGILMVAPEVALYLPRTMK